MEKLKISVGEEPLEVWVKGEILPSDAFAVAVVGARRASEQGKFLAREFVRELVLSGITIVSGGARGIDSVAHRVAIEFGGRTIAVLGSGIDIVYPPENGALFARISRVGALISQFAPGTPPLARNFKERNAVIAGLTKAVLVVEAARRSGTLNTASHAANLGVEVFAIPGSPGTDWLIGQGATLANHPADVIEYIKRLA